MRAANTTEWRFVLRDGVDVRATGHLCGDRTLAERDAAIFQAAVAKASINRDRVEEE